MRLIRKISSTITKQANNNTVISSINVQNLLNKYSQHFCKNSEKYQYPLLQANSILSYTSRFAKTAINLGKINNDQKKYLYKRIKNSILNSKFTPRSTLQICESLINFSFDGDQQIIFEKIRSYFQDNQVYLSSIERDRLDLAYKYIMTEKIQGNIKFKQLNVIKFTGKEEQFKQKIKQILKLYGVKQFSLSDWKVKKQIKITCSINGEKTKFVIRGINQQMKQSDCLLWSKKAINEANQNNAVLLIQPFNNYGFISQGDIKENLLRQQILIKDYNRSKNQNIKQPFNSIIQHICQLQHILQNNNIKVIELTPMKFINKVISFKQLGQLQQIFGYLKFNAFHIQFQKIQKILNVEHKRVIKKMFKLNLLDHLQLEQKKFAKILTPVQVQARELINLINQHNHRKYTIYIKQEHIQEFLVYMLNYELREQNHVTMAINQNRKFSILKSKLSLASTIYNIQIDLPAIKNEIENYETLLYPLRKQFH